jgi:neurofibromin 1
MYGKPFIVVLDATQFGPDNEISKTRLQRFSELIPKSILSVVPSIIVYNANTCFRRFLKRSNSPVNLKFTKRITFAITMKELAEYIKPSEVQLPKSTGSPKREPYHSCTLTPLPLLSLYQLSGSGKGPLNNHLLSCISGMAI